MQGKLEALDLYVSAYSVNGAVGAQTGILSIKLFSFSSLNHRIDLPGFPPHGEQIQKNRQNVQYKAHKDKSPWRRACKPGGGFKKWGKGVH